jgi:hypothetical protein
MATGSRVRAPIRIVRQEETMRMSMAARQQLFEAARDTEERERLLQAFLAGPPVTEYPTPRLIILVAVAVLSVVAGASYAKHDYRYSEKGEAIHAAASACADVPGCMRLATRYNWGNDVEQYLPSPGR